MPSKAVSEELRSLCQSPALLKSAEAVRLLRFLVEAEQTNQTEKLREVFIASELYGRDLTYDPKLDAVVRVNATRLRARLAEHYAAHPEAPLQIVIPKGGYVPRYEWRQPNTFAKAESAPLKEADPGPGQSLNTGEASLLPPVQTSSKSGTVWLALLLTAACICMVGWAAWRRSATSFATDGTSANGTSWMARSFSKLGGTEQFPTFSPDGRSIVFSWIRSPQTPAALYVQDVSSDVPRPLTGLSRAEDRGAWSPDGKRFALVQTESAGLKRIIVRAMPGGEETEVARLRGQAPWLCAIPKLSWSPDGKELFTASEIPDSGDSTSGLVERCSIVGIDLASHALRAITAPPANTLGDVEPTVSPDGRSLAFLRGVSYGVVDVYLVDLHDRSTRRFTYDNREIMGLTWDLQSSELILASRGQDGMVRLSRRNVKTGKTTLLTEGTGPAAFPDLSPSGRQIAFTSYRSTNEIRMVSRLKDSAPVNDQSLKACPRLSPDGKHLAFSSDRTGFAEIWISDANGQNSVRVTHSDGTGAQMPSWFPDGKSILFECRDQQHSQICRTETTGNAEITRLTHWDFDQVLPSLSRDGKRLYYLSNRSGQLEAYRQSLPAGEPEQLTTGGAYKVAESWDGKNIYVEARQAGVGILSIPTGHGLTETFGLVETNRAFVLNLPGFVTRNAWNAGPAGVIFSSRTGGRNDLIVFDDRLLKCEVLYRTSTKDEIETLSVGPDGLSVVYSTRPRRSAQIDILEPAALSQNTEGCSRISANPPACLRSG